MSATYVHASLKPYIMKVLRERIRDGSGGVEWKRGVDTPPPYLDVSKIKREERGVDVPPLVWL
jgi:hypothetical protein